MGLLGQGKDISSNIQLQKPGGGGGNDNTRYYFILICVRPVSDAVLLVCRGRETGYQA